MRPRYGWHVNKRSHNQNPPNPRTIGRDRRDSGVRSAWLKTYCLCMAKRMNWDKVSTQQRMRHPDETLPPDRIKPERGIAKKNPRKTIQDRRAKVSGAEVLMAKLVTAKATPSNKSKQKTKGTSKGKTGQAGTANGDAVRSPRLIVSTEGARSRSGYLPRL